MPPPPENCIICDEIAQQLDDPGDRTDAVRLCHIMLGGLGELDRYRTEFDGEARYVDIFPLVYWHTTRIELQRLRQRAFIRPIEKLQQMIVFLDAYLANREEEAEAEPHWARHFALAAAADKEFGGVGHGMAFDTPDAIERVLMSGIVAHADYDLPRTILAAFAERRHKLLTLADLRPDFFGTDETLKATVPAATDEMVATARQVSDWQPSLLSPVALRSWNRLMVATVEQVIAKRHRAWEVASAGDALLTGNVPAPVTDHRRLEGQGRLSCPAL